MKIHGSEKSVFTMKYRQLGFVVFVVILFQGCVNDIQKIKAFSSSEVLPVLQAENFETTFSDSGVIRFYLKTPELKRFETDEATFIEFPKGILLVKYNENREIVSSISARYAKQFVKENRWEAKNDVVATNNTGDTLKTEHLIWDEQAGRIYNNEYVKIIRPDQIISGVGFEADQSLQNWRIKNPKGPIYVRTNRQRTAPNDSVFGNLPVLRPVNISNP
jgi:LPS export ABC transporter protein LptC